MGDIYRLHAGCLIVLHCGHRTRQGRVHVFASKALFPCSGKAGFDVSRHKCRNSDPIGAHFVGKRCAKCVDGRFRRRIEALEGDRKHCGHRAYAEDAAAVLRAHLRQHGLNAVKRTEKVYIELALRIGRLREFNRAGDAKARVADEHVNPALPGDYRGNRSPHA